MRGSLRALSAQYQYLGLVGFVQYRPSGYGVGGAPGMWGLFAHVKLQPIGFDQVFGWDFSLLSPLAAAMCYAALPTVGQAVAPLMCGAKDQ